MKTKNEIDTLWDQYVKDCEKLWINHGRSASSPPTELYSKEKKILRDQLESDLL